MERKITILSIDDEENIRFALGELFHFQVLFLPQENQVRNNEHFSC